jgi:hypothetical protein
MMVDPAVTSRDGMDGLADDADILFLLTTNRLDILEPALASRPGESIKRSKSRCLTLRAADGCWSFYGTPASR